MAEMQLSFFDEPAAREDLRKQKQAELDACMIQVIGLKAAKQWHGEMNKRAAKLDAILNKPLIPKMQAAADRIFARVRAATKPLADEYSLLGIAPGATKRDIKNAYRRQARRLHPDTGGDEEAFKRMYAAYRKLLMLVKD